MQGEFELAVFEPGGREDKVGHVGRAKYGEVWQREGVRAAGWGMQGSRPMPVLRPHLDSRNTGRRKRSCMRRALKGGEK